MIRLYAATFGKPTGWIHHAVPIEVGAAGRIDHREDGILYDDTGDSISRENKYFGELTGLYWIWKNVSFEEGDIIGFCHYNKCLDRQNTEHSAVGKLFGKHQNTEHFWVVREAETMVSHDYPEDIEKLRKILGQEDTKYLTAFEALYDETGASRGGKKNCYTGNMFYTDRKSFDEYCTFLFRVLFRLREEIGDCDREAYHARYCAFLGERLLSVYLLKNGCAYETLETQYNESGLYRIVRKIGRVVRPIREKLHAGPTKLGKEMMKSGKSSYRK